MLKIFLAARALAQPLLALKASTLAALVAAVAVGVVGPFVAKVVLTPSGSSGPQTTAVVAGAVTVDETGQKTAVAESVAAVVDGVQGPPQPIESILVPAGETSSPPLEGLGNLQQVANLAPVDDLSFAFASGFSPAGGDAPAGVVDPSLGEPLGQTPGAGDPFADTVFFGSGGSISPAGFLPDPVDLSSTTSPKFDFSVTLDPQDPGTTNTDVPGSGANKGVTIPGTILTAVSEPSTLLLLSAGLGGLAFAIRRLIQ